MDLPLGRVPRVLTAAAPGGADYSRENYVAGKSPNGLSPHILNNLPPTIPASCDVV